MRKLIIAAVATSLSTIAAPAEQLLQCVNPDVLNGIVFFGRSEEKMDVMRGMPTAFGGFRTPAEFSLIGTGVRSEGGIQTVAYKTALSSDKAYSAMVAAFGVDGWALENSPGSGSTFNVEGAPRYGTLCRNAERRFLSVTELSGVRYANVGLYAEQDARACNAPEVMNIGGAYGPLRTAIPRFQFPAGTSIAQGGGGGGGGSTTSGSSPMVISSTRIISAETPAKLVEVLERQLMAQGWQVGSDWAGNGSAGSTWRKTIDGQLAWGTLEVVGVSQGTLDVDFTMTLSPR